eukprot:3033700-Pleurochrysis_carterae.AAC.4
MYSPTCLGAPEYACGCTGCSVRLHWLLDRASTRHAAPFGRRLPTATCCARQTASATGLATAGQACRPSPNEPSSRLPSEHGQCPLQRLRSDAAAQTLLSSSRGPRALTGESAWVDMLNPAARRWWSGLYSPAADLQCVNNESEPEISRFGCLRDGVWPRWLHAWNDMNEPSVFQGDQSTS